MTVVVITHSAAEPVDSAPEVRSRASAAAACRSRITRIVTYDGDLTSAYAPQSVTLCLADEIDISRGDLIVPIAALPHVSRRFRAHCVWMNAQPLEPGRSYTIFGAAWAGDTDVAEIWISLDGGGSWVQGDFVDPVTRHAWRRWKYDWRTPTQPGRYTLLARAKGADQRGQPDCHNPNYGSYVIDHPLPIEVFVAAP